MNPLLGHDAGGVDIQHAHLGGEDQLAVVRDIVPGRAQAVSIQHRPHAVSVGKEDGGRAVPWFHHGGIIMVEIFFILAHAAVVFPGLRNGDHHSQRQLHTAHNHKFQRVVQHSGIRAGCIDGWKNLVQFPFQIFGGHGFFPCPHLVRISQDGVDLPVVYHEPVRMGPLPAWIGVGAEPGMDHGDSRFVILILQVFEEETQLSYQEHALVDNGPAGE